MKRFILIGLVSLAASLICGFLTLPLLRRLKAGQPVEAHKSKNGTPTMGGLFFIIPAVIMFFLFSAGRIASVAAVIGLAFTCVGFIDDFVKIKFKKNDGLKAYQKIIFQTLISVVAGIFCYANGITVFHIPFAKTSVDLGAFTIPLVAIVFIAATNCVNLTDGLDGLAGTSCAAYLLWLTLLIGAQTVSMGHMYLEIQEYHALQTLAVSLVGALLGFLVFNTNKASVFMGDTGSLSLGGFIAAISIFSSNTFFIPIIGITFVLSGISVILQVAIYKRTKKRVFLMAPLHHHFQLKGYSESKITYLYMLVTLVCGALSVLTYWG